MWPSARRASRKAATSAEVRGMSPPWSATFNDDEPATPPAGAEPVEQTADPVDHDSVVERPRSGRVGAFDGDVADIVPQDDRASSALSRRGRKNALRPRLGRGPR